MLNTDLFLNAIDALEQQGVAREITIKALSEAFETVVKGKHDDRFPDIMAKVNVLPEEGRIDIFILKNIVEDVEDDAIEISLEDAREIKPDAQVGEVLELPRPIEEFTKSEAQKLKQVLRQKLKEAEKAAVLSMYADKIDELITGVVEKVESHYTLVNIGRTSVVLSDKEKIGDETFSIGQTVKVYLSGVGSSDSGITISRACPGFLKRLFEEEIHDVYDGTVIIKDIAREAGDRAKVSVTTRDINVDPVGACIGPAGSKIQKICSQINHEKIDVIQYHEHKGLFIAECLKPSTVLGVKLNEDGSSVAVVKDGDLRVAIGKRGVNARLAVKLAGCKIDIKESSVAESEGIVYTSIDAMKAEEEEMIRSARRQQLMEQIRLEEEARKRKAEEDALHAEEEAQNVQEEVAVEAPEQEVEETVAQEEVVKPVETVVEAPVEEEAEEVEEQVEYKPVNLQGRVSIDELEKQIEQEKKKKADNTNSRKKYKQEEEKVAPKAVDNTPKMDIYTQEELDALDEEEDYEEIDDEDIDYDLYDEYYEK